MQAPANDTTDAPLFDPGGVFWRVNRESLLYVGGGAALLLQIAHPLVAASVHDHSRFREQPVRRLYGTVTAMQRMIHGDRRTALEAARRVNRLHASVNGRLQHGTAVFPAGTRYDARDPAFLLWVHATLVTTALEVYETFFDPLSDSDRELYYEESKTIAYLVGLEPEQLPADLSAFRRYYEEMLRGPVLELTPVTRELAEHIIHPPISWFPRVAGDVLCIATAALLPEVIRERYGLAWSRRREMAWSFSRRVIRRALPYVPDVARTRPQVLSTERRLRARAR